MIKLLVIVGVCIFLYLVVRRALIGFQGQEGIPRISTKKDQMILDPVCKVYVPRHNAVEELIGGQTYYFCSQNCAHTFKKQLAG